MSELSSFKESQSFISGTYSGSIEQSKIDLEETISSTIKSSSIELSVSEANATNIIEYDKASGEFAIKKIIPSKYPLTEKSKRDRAAKVRMERERKSEQIKKINENITLGVEAIKVRNADEHDYNL